MTDRTTLCARLRSGRVVDAVVIGAGPNGLVAANMLADAGWRSSALEEQPAFCMQTAVYEQERTAVCIQNAVTCR
jgi:ribulose 1,5-bisphosphate synthetase/thiazole synthase